ncbi:odorant receptor 131-2-like [Solea senegalensis]|uniref:Odorant receptor 131-2-like n=1 Tax=Solea senegalensis TaxID=28829 RepID=A0AAV6QSG1_SOLSE|nr:odorant receptor 131-2-like [Solea senegalensis]KAG7495178.1 odorant receptor 131-2-like [Solea senegalensis]
MNLSNISRNFTAPVIRETLQGVIIKNVITVVLCISINYVNSTLVHTFIKHQVFNMNSRYILYIHLVINDIILLTLFTLIQVVGYIVWTLNVSLCMTLVLAAVFATINNPLTLAVMAVECYVAICFPLRHTQICTVKKTYAVIGVIWMLSSFYVLPDLFIALATESVEFFHSRLVCRTDNIFRNPGRKERRKIFNIVFLIGVWLTLFYTYFRILVTAQAAATDAKKARNTVLLHGFQLLLCMLTYAYYLMIDGLLFLFPNGIMVIRFAVSILIHILPRLISPVVYGLRDKTFRKYLKNDMFCTTSSDTHPQKKS